MGTILVIDDNEAVCTALLTLFHLQGYRVLTAADPTTALALFAQQPIDLVLQDMNFAKGEMQGLQGKSLFYQLRQQYPAIPVILMTAWTQLEMVVELVKAGASDYIAKPWDDARLLLTVQNVLKLKQLQDKQQQAERKQQERLAQFIGKDLCGLVFASTAMEQLLQMALQLAPSNAAVLITGDLAENFAYRPLVGAHIQRHLQAAIRKLAAMLCAVVWTNVRSGSRCFVSGVGTQIKTASTSRRREKCSSKPAAQRRSTRR